VASDELDSIPGWFWFISAYPLVNQFYIKVFFCSSAISSSEHCEPLRSLCVKLSTICCSSLVLFSGTQDVGLKFQRTRFCRLSIIYKYQLLVLPSRYPSGAGMLHLHCKGRKALIGNGIGLVTNKAFRLSRHFVRLPLLIWLAQHQLYLYDAYEDIHLWCLQFKYVTICL